MRAVVTNIQVCGDQIFHNLFSACHEYWICLAGGTRGDIAREKLNFEISLPNGQTKHITIRQEDDQVVAYGDFEGLPSMLEYSKDVAMAEYKEQEDIFWMCYVEGRDYPKRKHSSLEAAQGEAERLAILDENSGRKVFVLESIAHCEALPQPVEWHEL